MANTFKKEYKNGARWVVFAGRKNSDDAYTATSPVEPPKKDVLAFRRAIAKGHGVRLGQIEASAYPINADGTILVPCHMVHT